MDCYHAVKTFRRNFKHQLARAPQLPDANSAYSEKCTNKLTHSSKSCWMDTLAPLRQCSTELTLKRRIPYQFPQSHTSRNLRREKSTSKSKSNARHGRLKTFANQVGLNYFLWHWEDIALCSLVLHCKWNELKIHEFYQLPRMHECIDSLGNARTFWTLHAKTRYLQVDIAEEDQDKASFTSQNGLFRFSCIPYGLKMHQEWLNEKWTPNWIN